jgi:hypothetical protein
MCGTWKDNWQPRLPKPSPDDDWKAWPPWKMHANEMRRQALQSASFRRYSRPEAFRGSLEDGIHIRQTIRGLHGFPPVVYVRKSHRLREAVDLRGPVVWLFSDTEDKMEAGEIWFGLVERWDRRFVGAEFFQIGAAVPIASVPSIQLRRLAGLISYCDIGLEIGRVEEALGPAFHRRVPKSLAKVQLNFSLPWWQSLAIRAAQFADRNVIRIAMPEFSKVGEFDQKVREAGKEVVAVAPDFDSAHVRKLREMYWVARSPSPPRGSDTNKQQYEQDVGATYAAYLSQEITAADWRLY